MNKPEEKLHSFVDSVEKRRAGLGLDGERDEKGRIGHPLRGPLRRLLACGRAGDVAPQLTAIEPQHGRGQHEHL
jgi:hypothetical protein